MTRLFASLWLPLVLALAFVANGPVHGMSLTVPDRADFHAVVICADGHEATIFVDANGQPADPDAPCPEIGCADCPRLPASLNPDYLRLPGAPLAAPVRTLVPADQTLASLFLLPPSARGPPEKD